MSVNAEIITSVAQNVLIVPNSAVKSQGTTKYVQILVNGAPQTKAVTIGISNNTNTQILSGISAGDKVVTQTVSASAGTPASTTSNVRIPGVGGGFGGVRGGL